MAIHRNIQMSFWTDSKICDEFSPNEKYMYLYLMTNPHTNLCGCYEVSIRQIVFETGLDKKTVSNLLNDLKGKGVIDIAEETHELLLIHWHRYNWTSSDKFRKALAESISYVRHQGFKDYLTEVFEGGETVYDHEKYHNDTVSIPYPYPMDTSVSVSVTDTVSDTETASVAEEFGQLWSLYPKKQGKQNALKAYTKARKGGVTYEDVKQGIEAYRRYIEIKRIDSQYIKQGSTFFSQRAWEDDWSVNNGHTKFDEYDNGTDQSGVEPDGWNTIFGA